MKHSVSGYTHHVQIYITMNTALSIESKHTILQVAVHYLFIYIHLLKNLHI